MIKSGMALYQNNSTDTVKYQTKQYSTTRVPVIWYVNNMSLLIKTRSNWKFKKARTEKLPSDYCFCCIDQFVQHVNFISLTQHKSIKTRHRCNYRSSYAVSSKCSNSNTKWWQKIIFWLSTTLWSRHSGILFWLRYRNVISLLASKLVLVKLTLMGPDLQLSIIYRIHCL